MKFGNQRHLTTNQKKWFSFAVIVLLLAFVLLICFLIGKPMIEFVDEPEKFQAWVDKRGVFGKVVFLAMVITQVVLAIIPGEPIEIGAGYAFGAVEGSLLCILGMTIGSMLVFFIVRTLGIRVVEIFFSVDKIRSLKFLQKTKRVNFVVFILMFVPGTPKDLISYFVGLTNMKWQTWLLICLFARIPSIITSTIGGSALGVKDYLDAVIVFAITLVISGLGIVVYKLILRKRNKHIENEKNKCREIFSQFFDETSEFTDMLFNEFSDNLEHLKVKGEIVSILFKIPCEGAALGENNVFYLYGVATHKDFQGRGYIRKLMESCLDEEALYIVKPINDDVVSFYKKMGFKEVNAYKEGDCEIKIRVSDAHRELALMRGDTPDSYKIMYKWNREIDVICFSAPLS